MEYLEEMLDIKTRYETWNQGKMLPYFITDRYDFKVVWLDDTKTLFMYIKGEMDALSSIKKHVSVVQQQINTPVVLILEGCLPRQRKSLIKGRIPFIVCNKQIYLPFIGVALQEKYDVRIRNSITMIPSAQVLLFYYIYSRKKEMRMSEAVSSLGYSAMTITRAAKLLEHLDLIHTYKAGVSKILTSKYTGKELYEKSQQYLISPVRNILYLDQKKVDSTLVTAGYSALSEYTMFNEPNLYVYATESINDIADNELMDLASQVKVELWSYNPKLLTSSSVVDIFSLYETLKQDQNERVQGEVKSMMTDFWKENEW